MPKLEAVVTPMQQILTEVTCLFPSKINIDDIKSLRATNLFNQEAVSFLNALYIELQKSPNIREYPDVATFAFFCRKANINSLLQGYVNGNLIKLGRGIAFHIAPSNVPVNFAYSLICGILAGNVNIVRVPSKNFIQVQMIVDAIAKISETGHFKAITDKIFLIKYDRNSQATSLFSSICDVRIIWGGDETIAQIRKSQLPPRSFDITFADRYSVCVINADEFIQEEKPEKFALGFYNDTYLFDQNACTAPHLVLWVGNKENVIKSKSIFWNQVHQLVLQKYGPVQPVIAVDKLTSSFSRAIKSEGGHVTEVKDNLLWRIELDKLTKDIEEFRCTSGYFLEYHAHTINELAEIINRKYQTIAYYGLTKTELHDFVIKEEISGIDRIVPIGQTTNFSFVWDGFDLINTLSRAVQIN